MWLSQVALCCPQGTAPSPHPIPSHPQGINVYVGKHRSALVRAGGSLAALQARLREVTQVMSFTASSIAAALSDRVPSGQLSPDARRYLKSSLGMDVPSIPALWPSAAGEDPIPALPVASLDVFWANRPLCLQQLLWARVVL